MKILKRILAVLAILIALVLIVALFVKKDYAVEREIVINKPKSEVFEFLKYIKNQDQFSVWNQRDPNMKKSFKGTDGEVGFVYSWEGNSDVGIGEQEILKITEGERMDVVFRFKEPMEATDNAYLITEQTGESQTKVKWGFTGKMPYPWNVMCLFMSMDDMIGKDLQKGLDNLKVVLEKQ